MKEILTAMILALAVCGGCSDDGGGDGDGDGSGSTDDGGDGDGDSSTSGSSGQQTCDEQHSCINGFCQCDAGPKKGQSCCDPDDSSCTENKCDSFCEYCS